MRIGKVVGRITMHPVYKTLAGGRFLIVEVQDRSALYGRGRRSAETLVCYDHLGASAGDTIAISESREACMPFYPERIVPLDAYNAAILERVTMTHTI
jgi:microcompartment protein CcmK/EutM